MTEQARTAPDQESRLLAALAHGSIVAQGMGILIGVVIYLTQREKSRYAALQALQAAVYQFFILVVTIGMWMAWGVLLSLSMIPLMGNPNADPGLLFWVSMIGMVVPFLFMIAFGLYGLWAALRTWQGHDFHYIVIGRWMDRFELPAAPSAQEA